MPDATITSTASTFGTISGVFSADQSTISGTISGIVPGTLTGSVGVPGPAGAPGVGVPAGGTAGQFLTKIDSTNYNTDWTTVNLSVYAVKANNLSDLPSAPTARTNLGLGSLAVVNDAPSDGSQYARKNAAWEVVTTTPDFISSVSSPLSVTTGNLTVDLSAYAPLASPVFTGDARAVTPTFGDNDTSLATTAFVQAALAGGTAVARDLEVEVRNQSGSTIAAGSIVYISGATGNKPLITLAQANNDANSAQTIGFVKTAIANNGTGYVIVRGELENIDTSALTEGVQLYLSPTTAGTWTTTKPSAPQHLVYVGIVIRSHPTLGTILVAVQNGYELEELHDVAIGTLANNDLLAYESSTDLWKNKTFSALGLLTSADAASTYYLQTNPAGYQTAAQVSTALSPYLLSATAASTYFTIASAAGKANLSGATFTNDILVSSSPDTTSIGAGILGMSSTANSYVLTLSTAAGYPQIFFNGPTGMSTQTVAYPGPTGFLLKADNLSGLANTGTARTNLGLGTMATATAADYSTTTVANGLYYPLSGNPSSFLVAADIAGKADLASPTFTGVPLSTTAAVDTNTTQIATTAYVVAQAASATPLVNGTAAVGTSLRYARADHVHGTDTTRAAVDSQTFTGTPSLPTGTIGVTQTAGNNTTALATTAFVTTAVPAFATAVQAITKTSSTTSLNPSVFNFASAQGMSTRFEGLNSTSISGSGQISAGYNCWREMYTTTTASVGRGGWYAGVPGVLSVFSSRAHELRVDFSKKIWLFGRFGFTNSGYLGDANTTARITVGGYTAATTGAMTTFGIGLSKLGGVASFINLIVHNGSTQTAVATTKALALSQVTDYVIYSDGSGNVSLYLDGVLEATTSAGPTGVTANNGGLYREQVEATASAGVRYLMRCFAGGIILEA